ncbi:hypothetical protein P8C59_007695 [Phyllachora maydis]|uniref:Zn(2)-C6 fungal-type domain-containing protein n=1 Tax=Phyllachora maydis TaxID=1825666 RepID=A0AAD9I9K4_9PEZI|nr:hypothetical protein P8C59_007695 [Phyllachora maydis]
MDEDTAGSRQSIPALAPPATDSKHDPDDDHSHNHSHNHPHGASAAAERASKRRRGLGIVTANACTECRKKRAKCDGQKPCGRCRAQKEVECVYEVPVRQSKEHLRHEIDQLRRRQRTADQVLAALRSSDLADKVLRRLRAGQHVDAIADWLAGAARSAGLAPVGPVARPLVAASPSSGRREDVPSPWGGALSASTTPATRSNSVPGPAASASASASVSVSVSASASASASISPSTTWTRITADAGLVQHLLALYFCWEYPTFASLSKEHFLRDLEAGRARYCSSMLVNALLALGCRFSSRASTRADPHDRHTSGDHFFAESLRLLGQEDDHHSLTTIQALGIMSIREASCGRDSESWYYAGQSIRLALEMGLHRGGGASDKDDDDDDDDDEDDDDDHDKDDDNEAAVQAATFWGAFALDHAWSLATGSLPQCSCFPQLPAKPAIIDDIEASLWIPYTDDGKASLAPLHEGSYQQPSNVRSVYKCFCELSELVHHSLYGLHAPGRPLTSRDLLRVYRQYLDWYDRVPEVLRLGHNFTPAVLFAHMYYHFAILVLFRPLIKLRIIGSAISPRDVCLQAAGAMQALLRSYSRLYTLRRTPSFVPYFVLTSTTMHLALATATTPGAVDPAVAEAVACGIADLAEMAPCHHFAEQALHILRYLARKWRIDVAITTAGDEDNDDDDDGDDDDEGEGGREEAGERRRQQQRRRRTARPATDSLNFFAPHVEKADLVCAWGAGGGDQAKGGLPSGADALEENPLFWPFPMQGRPLLPTGPGLKEAGFAVLGPGS